MSKREKHRLFDRSIVAIRSSVRQVLVCSVSCDRQISLPPESCHHPAYFRTWRRAWEQQKFCHHRYTPSECQRRFPLQGSFFSFADLTNAHRGIYSRITLLIGIVSATIRGLSIQRWTHERTIHLKPFVHSSTFHLGEPHDSTINCAIATLWG